MTGDTTRHQCPIGGCQQLIPTIKLLCYAHWKRCPVALQRAVYAMWDNGRGAGSDGLRHAQDAAIAAVEAKLAAKAGATS